MKKFIKLLVILFISITAYSQINNMYESETANVKVRSKPSTDASIIGRLQEKQRFSKTEYRGGKIKTNNYGQ